MHLHRSAAGTHAASSGRCCALDLLPLSTVTQRRQALRRRCRASFRVCADQNRREFGATMGALAALQLAPAAEGVQAGFCNLGASYVCVDSDDPELVRIETLMYALAVPSSYQKLADYGGTDSELVLRFTSPDGKQSASLVKRDASSVKPTFFQVSDISQYGNLQQVGSIVVPKGGKDIIGESETFPQLPFDTRTPRGIVEQPDVNIYRYRFTLGSSKVALAVGALRGKIYFWGVSTPPEEWDANMEQILKVSRSFRLARQTLV